MPDTAMKLYPTAQPPVKGYRSILTDAGGVGAGGLADSGSDGSRRRFEGRLSAAYGGHGCGATAGLLTAEERLAWAWQERVDCTSACFPRCLQSCSFRKLFYPSISAEVTGHAVVATRGTSFRRGAVLMRAGGRHAIWAAGPARLGGTRRWPAAVEVASVDSRQRGKA